MTDTEWSERIDQAISEYPEVGEYLGAIRGNIEALAARLAAVEEMHEPQPGLGPAYCTECDQLHPCDTTKAARGE